MAKVFYVQAKECVFALEYMYCINGSPQSMQQSWLANLQFPPPAAFAQIAHGEKIIFTFMSIL